MPAAPKSRCSLECHSESQSALTVVKNCFKPLLYIVFSYTTTVCSMALLHYSQISFR